MRILFSSLPLPGHSYPLIPLAMAARDAGHEVQFATGQSFHQSLSAFGLDAVAAGMGVSEALTQANGDRAIDSSVTPERQMEIECRAIADGLPRSYVADLEPILDQFKPDLIVHEIDNVGALFAAKLAGIPGVGHSIGRVYENTAIETMVSALASELGVDLPVPASRGGGNRLLDIFPSSLQSKEIVATASRIALRPVPMTAPGQPPSWVMGRDRNGGRPLVYLTFGAVFGSRPALRLAIEGLSAMEVDVLVAVPPSFDTDALGEIGESVRIETSEPQAELLSLVDLVVHHGGTGLTLGALGNGVTQLVLPQDTELFSTADMWSNADAVATSGVGARLLPESQTADTIGTVVTQLLGSEEARVAARESAAEIARMPSPESTVAVLSEIASR